MSILITAPIRTGKTLFVLKCIFEELNKGRQVYTNIVGIKIDGVISVASSIGEPFDWRDLPNGSVLVWDEAHEHPSFSEKDLLKDFTIDETEFDYRIIQVEKRTDISTTIKKQFIENINKERKLALIKKKEQIKDIGTALLMHGHFGIEIYFITQRPAKLNADVLASVTTHFVMRRKFGMDAALIWEFGEAMTTWSKSTAEIALNKKLWRYPKHLYNFYVSSESHQVRKSFPAIYYGFLLIPLFLFGYGFLKAKETGFFGLFPKEEKQVTSASTSAASPVANANPTTQQPASLICTYENLHTPECQALQNAKQQKLNYEVQTTTIYNVNDPYATEYPQHVMLQNSDFPRLSGCIKYNGKYHGIDQQGNQMPKLPQEACRRWIEQGQRPFDYYKAQNQYNEPRTQEDQTQQSFNNVSVQPQLIQPSF